MQESDKDDDNGAEKNNGAPKKKAPYRDRVRDKALEYIHAELKKGENVQAAKE